MLTYPEVNVQIAFGRREVHTMSTSNEDLAKEIKELKDEIRQMREIVSILFSMVMEGEEDDDEMSPFPGNLEVPRLNN
jgi:cell division protein FtsB